MRGLVETLEDPGTAPVPVEELLAEAARLDPSEPIWPYGRALIALRREPDKALDLLRTAEARAVKGTDTHAGIALRLGEALLERALGQARAGERFQFVRQGYFYVDEVESKAGAPVFNRTMTLKDNWAKPVDKAPEQRAEKKKAATTTLEAMINARSKDPKAKGDVKVLGVTVLTSLDRGDLDDLGFSCDVEQLVLSRARRALDAARRRHRHRALLDCHGRDARP